MDLLQMFKPTQELSLLQPVLLFIVIVVGTFSFIWLVMELYQRWSNQKRELRLFHELADKFHLTKPEVIFLLRLVKKRKIRPYQRILFEQNRFERAVSSVKSKSYRNIIQKIRGKLFNKFLSSMEEVYSTRQLFPGIRLMLKYLDYPDMVLWAHLIDMDESGLVVVVPASRKIKIPLRPETVLEMVAYLPEHEPVVFRSRVKSVIPGPQRMVVIDHSQTIVEGENSSITIGPQDYLREKKHFSTTHTR